MLSEELQKLDVVGDCIRLRNSTAEGAKEIMLRTDGSAVNVNAGNADLYLYSHTGNIVMWPGGGSIYWTGHLGSMTVTGDYGAESHDDGWEHTTMVPASNSICFLTRVEFEDIDTGGETSECRIDQSGGYWRLGAWAEDDSDAWCWARCLQW